MTQCQKNGRHCHLVLLGGVYDLEIITKWYLPTKCFGITNISLPSSLHSKFCPLNLGKESIMPSIYEDNLWNRLKYVVYVSLFVKETQNSNRQAEQLVSWSCKLIVHRLAEGDRSIFNLVSISSLSVTQAPRVSVSQVGMIVVSVDRIRSTMSDFLKGIS